MNGTASRGEQSARAGGGWLAVEAIAAYAAAALAFGYALISLYWSLGGHGLLGTVGGAIERFARRGAGMSGSGICGSCCGASCSAWRLSATGDAPPTRTAGNPTRPHGPSSNRGVRHSHRITRRCPRRITNARPRNRRSQLHCARRRHSPTVDDRPGPGPGKLGHCFGSAKTAVHIGACSAVSPGRADGDSGNPATNRGRRIRRPRRSPGVATQPARSTATNSSAADETSAGADGCGEMATGPSHL